MPATQRIFPVFKQMMAALKRGSGPSGIGRVSGVATPAARGCTT
jgi:hypothetical protein